MPAGVFLDHTLRLMSKQGLTLTLELRISDSLASQLPQKMPCLSLPHSGVTGTPPCPLNFRVGFGVWNSVPHAHMVSAPFSELSPILCL